MVSYGSSGVPAQNRETGLGLGLGLMFSGLGLGLEVLAGFRVRVKIFGPSGLGLEIECSYINRGINMVRRFRGYGLDSGVMVLGLY